jgi:hypothetical protein
MLGGRTHLHDPLHLFLVMQQSRQLAALVVQYKNKRTRHRFCRLKFTKLIDKFLEKNQPYTSVTQTPQRKSCSPKYFYADQKPSFFLVVGRIRIRRNNYGS